MYGLRGLGDTVVTDPVTGQQKVILSTPTTENVYASGAPSTFVDASGTITTASPGTLTDWLNTNATMVALGAAALLALFVVAKAGR